MPHEPLTLEDILDLNDPIDRQIFKLNLTVQELQLRQIGATGTEEQFGLNIGGGLRGQTRNVLDVLRLAASGTPVGDVDISGIQTFTSRGGTGRTISGGRIPRDQIFDQSFGRLRTDLLGRKALQLFPDLVLPDFLKPLNLPEDDELDARSQAAADAVADKQTFTTLFTESLTARIKDDGTGREDLVRRSP